MSLNVRNKFLFPIFSYFEIHHYIITHIHPYIPVTLYLAGVAETSQIFLRDTRSLPIRFNYEKYNRRDRWSWTALGLPSDRI
jgi:hypothetical protein